MRAFELPKLPYAKNALAPYLSEETLEYHYGRHHAAYVKKLNELIANTNFARMPLEEIIKTADHGPIFNNAAQPWNHTFYWNCLTPEGGGEPRGALASAINRDFKSFKEFSKEFSEAAIEFGSGWAWLVQRKNGSLAIEKASNADDPLVRNERPLLACDVWEHAYYIDYRNARPKYVVAFWHLVNWDFVASNMT